MRFDSEGTYNLVYTAEDDCGNKSIAEREVIVKIPKIYGAVWAGGSSPAWTRTDLATDFADPVAAIANGDGSSPFDDIMPWSGMQIVEDAEAGTLVSIPKYWYKWTREGASMKLQISPERAKGFFISPAHADRGDGVGVRDVVYVGRYHSASDYKSKSGVQPLISRARPTCRSGIHALGSDIWQYDFAMFWTIAMLYLVEYANWNSQAIIGYGCGTSSLINEGSTDAMIYHTGTDASSRTTYGSVQYRHIEGLWNNVWDWCDGIFFNDANVYCVKNPSDFNDTTGVRVGTRNKYVNAFSSSFSNPSAQGFEYALYPLGQAGSGSTYICDKTAYNAGGVALYVGAYYSFRNQDAGLFYMNGLAGASVAGNRIGCRLMKLPSA